MTAAALDCGDFTNDGNVNAADVVAMLDYLISGGPPPSSFDVADFDEHQLLTFNDAARLMGTFGSCDVIDLPCPPTLPPFEPDLDEIYYYYFTVHTGIYENLSEVTVSVSISSWLQYAGFVLPLRLRVSGQIPSIDSIHFPIEGSAFAEPTVLTADTIVADSGIVVLGALDFGEIPSGEENVALIYLSFPPVPEPRQVEVYQTKLVPAQSPTNDSTVFPMIAYYCGGGSIPNLFRTCCVVAGDIDYDGTFNIADAVYRINWTFKGGPAPACCDAADTNNNGAAGIDDAVNIINHIFKGGPPPVCGSAGNGPCL